MRFDDVIVVRQPIESRVGRRIQVIVNLQLPGFVEVLRAEVSRCFQRHVTTVAVHLSLLGIVKAASSMSRNAAQQPTVIVVLPSQPILIMIQRKRQVDLVARSAELRRLMQRLQECLFVE